MQPGTVESVREGGRVFIGEINEACIGDSIGLERSPIRKVGGGLDHNDLAGQSAHVEAELIQLNPKAPSFRRMTGGGGGPAWTAYTVH